VNVDTDCALAAPLSTPLNTGCPSRSYLTPLPEIFVRSSSWKWRRRCVLWFEVQRIASNCLVYLLTCCAQFCHRVHAAHSFVTVLSQFCHSFVTVLSPFCHRVHAAHSFVTFMYLHAHTRAFQECVYVCDVLTKEVYVCDVTTKEVYVCDVVTKKVYVCDVLSNKRSVCVRRTNKRSVCVRRINERSVCVRRINKRSVCV